MAGPHDPIWRGFFFRSLYVVAAVALLTRIEAWLGAIAALVGAAMIATQLTLRIAPLRRRVAELGTGKALDEALDLEGLARSIDQTREAMERTERKAELERDDLLGVLEATADGVLVLGHELRIELINDAARRVLVPEVEPLGVSLHEIARRPELITFAEALRRGDEPDPLRLEVAVAGETRSLAIDGSIVPGASMRRRVVVVLHDLTDLQHLERVRTDFVANVSHEMRSPLTSILGYAETLADNESLDVDGRDHIARVVRNARRLDDIVRDLIELSRLEHATTPEAEPTDVGELIDGAVDAARDRAEQKRIELAVATEALPPRLMVDPGLLHQALSNLIDNAVKYTPEGGRVSVAAEVRAAAGAQVPTRRDLLEISVADTGPGIPREHLARIFERFYRVDTARSRALGGTGLGLAIVKHAAALHGGRVRVESEPGQGTTFRVELETAAPA